jgi:hypothetical protein
LQVEIRGNLGEVTLQKGLKRGDIHLQRHKLSTFLPVCCR